MEIEAKSQTTIQELLEARQWHWKKHGSLQYLWYVAGALIIFLGLLLATSENRVFAIYLLVVGIYCISRKKILEYRFRKNMKSAPAIDKEIEWKINTDGFSQNSELGSTELAWCSVYQSYTTKNGFLLYPQKNIYFWLPRTGFKSDKDYEEADKIFKAKTKNKNID